MRVSVWTSSYDRALCPLPDGAAQLCPAGQGVPVLPPFFHLLSALSLFSTPFYNTGRKLIEPKNGIIFLSVNQTVLAGWIWRGPEPAQGKRAGYAEKPQ